MYTKFTHGFMEEQKEKPAENKFSMKDSGYVDKKMDGDMRDRRFFAFSEGEIEEILLELSETVRLFISVNDIQNHTCN